MNRSRWSGLAAAASVLLVSACGSSPLAETSSRTPSTEQTESPASTVAGETAGDADSPTPTTSVAVPATNDASSGDGSGNVSGEVSGEVVAVYFPNQIASHETGSQAWFRQLDIGADGVRATIEVVNGFRQPQSLADAAVLIIGGQELIGGFDDQTIEPATDKTVIVQFPPLDEGITTGAEEFTLALNVDETGELNSSTFQPSFVFPAASIIESNELIGLPKAFPVALTGTSRSGVTVGVTDVSFSNTRIGIGIVVANTRSSSRTLGGSSDETFLTDDLGNRYGLVEPTSNTKLQVDRFEQLRGQLIFAGHIHPKASTLTLTINGDSDPASEFSPVPFFSFGPMSLDGSDPLVGLPTGIALGESQVHPNSVEVTLTSVDFDEGFISAVLSVTNPRSTTTRLNSLSSTVIVDDRGNRYPLVESPRNEDLEVDAGATVGISLVFSGPFDPQAATITLLINDRGEEYQFDDATSSPAFVFGAYETIDRLAPETVVPLDVSARTDIETVEFAERSGVDS